MLFGSLFEHLDRRTVDLVAYGLGKAETPLARRILGRAEAWQDLGTLDPDTAALMLRNDALDVLIDLDGPERGAAQIFLLACPAPLTLGAYGIPDLPPATGLTLSLSGYPAPGTLAVPGGLAVMPTEIPVIRRDKPINAAEPIFGTLAAPWQITPRTIALWAEILLACPAARLLLDGPDFSDQAQWISEQFHPYLPDGRVLIRTDDADGTPSYAALVDILLDPPDNPDPGAVLSMLALGTPVITRTSALPRANILADWFTRIGLDALVARHDADYVANAIRAITETPLTDQIITALTLDAATGGPQQAARLAYALVDRLIQHATPKAGM